MRIITGLLALLLFTAPEPSAAAERLTVLHFNDLHGWLLPHRRVEDGVHEGGVARLAALAERERTERTLFLAAGDLMQGTNISNLFQGRPAIEALRAMGLDASAVGNHDFDYGLEVFAARAAEAGFPFLAANIEGEGTSFLAPSTIKKVGGLRVALFGLTTEETPTVTHPRNVEGLTFASPLKTAENLVPRLREESDLVICLSHLGLDEDRRLAEAVDGIDVIIGGHTHTRLDEPIEVNDTVIVQAYERGVFLGRLDLTVDSGRVTAFEGKLIPVDGSAGEDPEVAMFIEEYRLEASRKMDVVVGRALVHFEGERPLVRSRETNLGNLVADVIRDAAAADVAIMNGGGIQAGIPKGPVTLAHLYNVLPFDNYVVAYRLSGRQIRAALETGLAKLPGLGGGFPQVSGLRFTFDPSAPAGSRLRRVTLRGAALRGDGTYRVATNDFLAAGGDRYEVFKNAEPVFVDSSRFLRDLLADYWRGHGSLAAGAAGRIREVP